MPTLKDISTKLNEKYKQKLVLLAEINYMEQVAQSIRNQLADESREYISTEQTSADIYANQPVTDYLMDRHGKSHSLLHPPKSGRLLSLNNVLGEDVVQAYNGWQPNNVSNVSGLGGVHGPKYGFGSRLQMTENYTRFRDELMEPLICGLQPRTDYDEQYYRVNFTQLNS